MPIVSGNVSLYNESSDRIIFPTPVVGMVGLMEDAARSVGLGFAREGDLVLLAGHGDPCLDASEWLGRAEGRPPAPDPVAEAALVDFLAGAAERGLLAGAHDVSSGGVAACLAESAIAGGLGARVALPVGRRRDEALFGEGGGRALLTCAPADLAKLRALAGGVRLEVIGEVGGDDLAVDLDGTEVRVGLAAAREAWERGLAEALGA